MTIYGLYHPKTNVLRYIGKTKNLKIRMYSHLCKASLSKKNKNAIWLNNLKKQGLKPIVKILCECSPKNIDRFEKHYISLYRNKGLKLNNERSGGDGWNLTAKRRWTEACLNGGKSRMRKVTIRNVKTEKEIQFNSAKDAAKYLKSSDTTLSAYLKNKPGFRICKGFYIRYTEDKFEEPVDRLNKYGFKRIDLLTKKETVYKNRQELKKGGYDSSHVSSVCRGDPHRKTLFGFKWEFIKYVK